MIAPNSFDGEDNIKLPSMLLPLDRHSNKTRAKQQLAAKQARQNILGIGFQRNQIDSNSPAPRFSEPMGDDPTPTIPDDPIISRVPVHKQTNSSACVFVASKKISTQEQLLKNAHHPPDRIETDQESLPKLLKEFDDWETHIDSQSRKILANKRKVAEQFKKNNILVKKTGFFKSLCIESYQDDHRSITNMKTNKVPSFGKLDVSDSGSVDFKVDPNTIFEVKKSEKARKAKTHGLYEICAKKDEQKKCKK